jgi:DNA mismatch repair protein MutL
MAPIIKLSPHEARKIAAGEVVERPANIVKELVENSIDAGATQITLYVQDGGRETIRIVDNGCGMNEEDAILCFEHHATSKIKTVADLETIATFGFRGEALSSIAAVSSVTLVTKTADAQTGIKLTLEQGSIQKQEAVSANTGTDITVDHILHNLPARKKFLKTRETEFNHINRFFQAFCLCYPQIHFKIFSENTLTLNCPATDSLITRIGQVWDLHSAPHMIMLKEQIEKNSAPLRTNNGFSLAGAISNHQHARYDRTNILFFVNNRLVKNQHLMRAVLKGYAHVLPPARFPATSIFITVDPKTIDVNIHPRKEEVQFLHPRTIEVALEQAIKHTLEEHITHTVQHYTTANISHTNMLFQKISSPDSIAGSCPLPSSETPTHRNTQAPSIPPSHLAILQRPAYSSIDSSEQKSDFFPIDHKAVEYSSGSESHRQCPSLEKNVHEITDLSVPEKICATKTSHEQALEQIDAFSYETRSEPAKNYQLLGQLHKTYLLLEKKDGLYIVDQHAAHERILYELFRTRFDDATTVTLMFPQIITLTPDAIITLLPYLALFQAMGIALDQFSDHQLSITATPVYLKNINFQELITDALSWITEYQSLEQHELNKKLTEKIHASMACKAAVKAGDELTHEQMIKLLDDLSKTANNFSCPHGRPTGWLMGTYEIEKKFKRKL